VSLTAARGPLGRDPAGRFSADDGEGVVYIEPHPRRVQAMVNGHAVIDTERALMVHRPGRPLSYAFPAEAVGDLPSEPELEAPGFVQVPWDSVDTWVEEGRPLVHYPPNPYHRVDCRPTTRRLRVDVDGTVLVDTDDTIILFETALGAKLYVAPDLVRTDLLRRSDTSSWCNYKGRATWWTFVLGDLVVEDVAWSYEDPLDESVAIRGHLSFDPERAGVEAELPVGSEGADCGGECALPQRP
jgi:uncharacterized protein (DUF427 family)